MLEVGSRGILQTRRQTFDSAVAVSMLYASDLHLSARSCHVAQQFLTTVRAERPDVLLLGGDLVDTRRGLPYLADLVGSLTGMCPVWAVPGNHDEMVGVDAVRLCIEGAGGHWLPGQSLTLANGAIVIDALPRFPASSAVYSILCTHDPASLPGAGRCGYDLVLAGHLHGSQFVFARHAGRLYPGALFFRWNGDRFQIGKTIMLVSRGINDTLALRWNCPREVLLCKFG